MGAYIWQTNNVQVKQTNIDNCMSGTMSWMFYCVKVLDLAKSRLKYNQTHFMYKFTIANIVCPSQSYGAGDGGYHVKFKI